METKKKLVVLVSRFPFPLEKGDKLRSYYQIKELEKKYDVHLIALSDKKVADESVEELINFCATTTIYNLPLIGRLFHSFMALLGKKPIQVGYFYNRSVATKIQHQLRLIQPDLILTQLVRTTEYTKNYFNCPKVLDYMDAFSKGIERRVDDAPWYLKWFFRMESKRLKQYERSVFDYFDKHLIISDQDKRYIFHPDKDKIQCVPNGIAPFFFEKLSVEKKYDFVFVGNMNYAPNVKAVLYIIKEILPDFPDTLFLVAGADPHAKIIKASQQNKQVVVSGWVDDIREAYLSAHVFLAPMKSGTGMQNKLLEAMALGLPCVTTSLANNAIKATNKESIMVCDTTEETKVILKELLANEQLRSQIGESGREFVRQQYSWENILSI